MSSFIETTLPPGYAIFTHAMSDYGEECDPYVTCTFGVECYWYRVFDEICPEMYRAAWRHWTATVLRGHRLHWMRTEDGRLIASANDPSILHDPSILWRPLSGLFIVGVEYKDEALGWDILTLAASRDVDEAMARFAALVLAAEGMVPR
jgi:hypothetical protein